MSIPKPDTSAASARLHIAVLLLGSMGCVLALMAVLMASDTETHKPFGPNHWLVILAIAVSLALAGLSAWRMLGEARRQMHLAHAENIELQRSLSAADAIIRSEPQALVFWDLGQKPKVVAHTLTGVQGLPSNANDLLTFAAWLEPQGAQRITQYLDALFASGRPFATILKTKSGGHVDADGRAAGGRALLRLREVAGYKRDLGRIQDLHMSLARDIKSSRALLDTLPMPVWLRDGKGRLSWINKAYVAAVEGANDAEVLDKQIELLEQRQRKAVAKTLAGGEAFRERAHLVIGGERKPHDIVILPLDDISVGAAIDVTAVENVQEKLEREIAAYDRTLDRVGTAVAIFNRDEQLVFFNEAYRKLWNIESDWLKARPTDGEVLDRLRELGRLPAVVNYRDWRAKVLACYKTGAPFEDTWHLLDGRVVHVIGEQRPDAGVTYLFADVTESLALESRYNALIDVQRETLDRLSEGVAVFGTDGRLKLFNPAFATIWQIPAARLAERPHIDTFIAKVRTLANDDIVWDRIARSVTSFLEERNPFEGQIVRRDGNVIDYAAMPLSDGATLLTFADVTDAKRYERALIERNEALVAADRLKNQFISHVSYELRTPLTNIIGFSEFVSSPIVGTLNDKQREYISDITFSSKTLLSIIDDILDLATIDAGGMELKLTYVGVRAVLDAAILGIRERAIRARLTLDIAVADDANEFLADEARIRQVLYNLLSNAVGFSNPGDTIHLTCWKENGDMIFSVADQGVGIPQDQIDRVFQRFESRSQGSKHRGAGLGLSIAKSIVDLHRGKITIESQSGKGTKVIVRLPLDGGSSNADLESNRNADDDPFFGLTSPGSAA